jgi:4'-phosphopantetheinyl transferase
MMAKSEIVRVRFLALEGVSEVLLELWWAMLDDQERQRADRFRFRRDRDAFTAAHALARAMLSEATAAATISWRFVHGPYGKPEIAPGNFDHQLSGHRDLRFNISHTNGLAACAVTYGRDLGVDVEASDRAVELEIADRYFAPEEIATIRSAAPDQRQSLLFRFWTLKEAFIKATGEGLSRPLDSFAFTLDPIRISFHPNRDDARRDDNPTCWQFAQCRPFPNRFLALAVRRPETAEISIDIQAALPHDIALSPPFHRGDSVVHGSK